MFRQVSAEAYKHQPGPHRKFGATPPLPPKDWEQTSWIPKRKDKSPKKEASQAQEPPAQPIVEPVDAAPANEPELTSEPEHPRAPPVLMSRKAMGKAMKAARKSARAKTARPMMRSTSQGAPRRRKTEAAPKKKRASPPIELNAETFQKIARKALNRFKTHKVKYPHEVLCVMLGVTAGPMRSRMMRLVSHAVSRLEHEIPLAQQARKKAIDHAFLHSACTRAYGELIRDAFHCVVAAQFIDDSAIYRRLGQVQRDEKVRHELQIQLYRQKGREIYFLVEGTDLKLPIIHVAMTPARFRNWVRGRTHFAPYQPI